MGDCFFFFFLEWVVCLCLVYFFFVGLFGVDWLLVLVCFFCLRGFGVIVLVCLGEVGGCWGGWGFLWVCWLCCCVVGVGVLVCCLFLLLFLFGGGFSVRLGVCWFSVGFVVFF